MKVKTNLIKYKAKPTLKPLIIEKYKTVRSFSYQAGFSESLLSRIFNNKRTIYEWHIQTFNVLLDITPDKYDTYFERITDGNSETYGCRYNTYNDTVRSDNIA